MRNVTLCRTIFCSLLFFPVATSLPGKERAQQVWPQWRGPHRDGMLVVGGLPEALGEKRMEKLWQVDLGPSYSGPIIAENKVFVTETINKTTEIVRALDRRTGKQIWMRQWEGALSVPFFAKANGDWIRATPAFDGERLYVAGIRDVLVCLEAETGKQLWRLDFVETLGSKLPAFGFVSSPLVVGKYVYVQAGGGFCKIDKLTGKLIWRVLDDGGGMYGSAFSSPYFTTLHGAAQIIVQTRTTLAGVDPHDGRIFWEQKVPAFRGMNILTPTVYKNSIFTSTYGGRSFLFSISKNDEDQWSCQETWTHKAKGYMSSPLVIDGHVYLHLQNRRFTCLNLETGQEQWTTKPFGKYWSCVSDSEKILALDEKGELLLIRANPEKFELLDRRKVADDSWAHLAVSGNEIFVRALNDITVYRWK